MSSHAAGWSLKWAELLDAEIQTKWTLDTLKDATNVYLWNDINGEPGVLNIFGFKPDNEVGEAIQDRVDQLSFIQNKLVQLDYPQTWGECLRKRKLRAGEWMDGIPVQDQMELNPEFICAGDSHSISVTPRGWACNRNDGQTLHGALKKGLKSYITDVTKQCIFKFGDIDLRHHLCRQDNPERAMEELVDEYLRQAYDLKAEGVDVILAEAMPQTKDTRKIPKTGYYKGTPYYGSFEDRQYLTDAFNYKLNCRWSETTINYSGYEDTDGSLDEKFMESGGSFHLAPHSYNNVGEIFYAETEGA